MRIGTLLLASCLGVGRVTAQDISPATLRADLGAFSHDSMRGRYTGSIGSERATAFIIARLTRAGITPVTQAVPIVIHQLDGERAKGGDVGQYMIGVDYLPLVGAFGIGTPDSMSARADYVAAGEIGSPGAAKPGDVRGQFPVFLAPSRANGVPGYQLWDMRGALLSYRDARALFVATLDLMPKSFVEEMLGPRMILKERTALLPPSPPIIAITRGIARKAVGSVNQRLSYVVRETNLSSPAKNVVAVVEGSDPQLKSEFVVVSAHTDHLGMHGNEVFDGANAGSGAIALLAIAEEVAARPIKPKRSVLFLWTTGATQGWLGMEYFADHPTVPRQNIAASVSVGNIGRPARDSSGVLRVWSTGDSWLSSEMGAVIDAANGRAQGSVRAIRAPAASRGLPRACSGDEWHFARWGVPGVRLSGDPHPSDNTAFDMATSIDFVAFASVTRYVSTVIEELAGRDERPRLDAPKPDERTACAR